MRRLLLGLFLLLTPASVAADVLGSWTIFGVGPPAPIIGACNNQWSQWRYAVINKYVTNVYIEAAAHADAGDFYLLSDYGWTIAEAHTIKGQHPTDPSLRYWQEKRDFAPNKIWIGSVWYAGVCTPAAGSDGSLEPYAVIYYTPFP